jgi:ABC-2 type transport system ATP-binding protein
VLQVHEVRKSYGSQVAVKGVSLRIATGETLGLLGPNGAGKTTTVSMIAGLMYPDAGEVRIEGRALSSDTDPLKNKIGLVPQEVALFDDLSAAHNLALFGALYGLRGQPLADAVDRGLAFAGLADRAKDKVKAFSGGMKRRLNIAAALLHDPALLILDEPTVGVDPQSRNAIFENLESLKVQGKTLLYTTHYREEAERLCDRIVILDHGEVVADDTLAGLSSRVPARNVLKVELEGVADGSWIGDLAGLPVVSSAVFEGNVLKVVVTDLGAGSASVLAWLAERGFRVSFVGSARADLETVFLALTGRALRDT